VVPGRGKTTAAAVGSRGRDIGSAAGDVMASDPRIVW
jgi:hypothetical protein